ncbi:unnamed protein product [Caenorhabditis sp. 36 PRJEB53466]|nr:unnamed protein product [Caenorhabditis sp. 36 PRJEB53466]
MPLKLCLLFLILYHPTMAAEDKYSMEFLSDTSSLSYRAVFIKKMVDEAIRKRTALEFELTSSEPVNFGFLKCGIFGLSTTTKLYKVRYVFKGVELENLRDVIGRSCAIRSMYPLIVHFDVPANSSKSYPIQMKALVRRSLRNFGSRLEISTFLTAPSVKYSMRRCDWELDEMPLVQRTVLTREHAESIGDLIINSCDSEWLVDTVNVHIVNSGDVSVSGLITYAIVYEDEETSNIPIVPETTSRTHLPVTSVRNVAKVLPVERLSTEHFNHVFLIIIAICGAIAVLTTFYRYKMSKSRVYHIADHRSHNYKSVLPG